MAPLTTAELHAPRAGFFPTLLATLNHILEVDQYYVGALHGEAGLAAHWTRYVPDRELAPLAGRQRLCDERLIAFCDALDDAGCTRVVEMPRAAGRVQRDAAAFVLQHLFMHQTHHRGQVHAMLSGTAVAPPQLDEFLMPSDADLRRPTWRPWAGTRRRCTGRGPRIAVDVNARAPRRQEPAAGDPRCPR